LRGVSVVSELLFELAPFKTAKLCLYDFPYNERMKLGVSDAERTAKAIKGIVGKHLIIDGLTKSLNQADIKRQAKRFQRRRKKVI
jgi:hypothetical protein